MRAFQVRVSCDPNPDVTPARPPATNQICWCLRRPAGLAPRVAVFTVCTVDIRNYRTPPFSSSGPTVVAAVRSAQVGPAAGVPTGALVPALMRLHAAEPARLRRGCPRIALQWTDPSRPGTPSAVERPERLPSVTRRCTRNLDCGLPDVARLENRFHSPCPVRGCWRWRGIAPVTGRQDIRHGTSCSSTDTEPTVVVRRCRPGDPSPCVQCGCPIHSIAAQSALL